MVVLLPLFLLSSTAVPLMLGVLMVVLRSWFGEGVLLVAAIGLGVGTITMMGKAGRDAVRRRLRLRADLEELDRLEPTAPLTVERIGNLLLTMRTNRGLAALVRAIDRGELPCDDAAVRVIDDYAATATTLRGHHGRLHATPPAGRLEGQVVEGDISAGRPGRLLAWLSRDLFPDGTPGSRPWEPAPGASAEFTDWFTHAYAGDGPRLPMNDIDRDVLDDISRMTMHRLRPQALAVPATSPLV
jgi:hypothetical protein